MGGGDDLKKNTETEMIKMYRGKEKQLDLDHL